MRAVLALFASLTGCADIFDIEHVSVSAMLDAGDADAVVSDVSLVDAAPICPNVFGTSRHLTVSGPTRMWGTAEIYCRALDDMLSDGWYTHLAVISQPSELLELHVPGVDVWIGYTDAATGGGPPSLAADFKWVTDEPTSHGPGLWNPGDPDSSAAAPYCAYIGAQDGVLHDATCEATLPFICECDQYPENPMNIFP